MHYGNGKILIKYYSAKCSTYKKFIYELRIGNIQQPSTMFYHTTLF